MKASINLYKYQKENEELKQQNFAIRKELEKYRPKDSNDLKWPLIDLLDLQRKRITSLESELEQLKTKYVNIQKEQEPAMRIQNELSATNKQAEILQQNLDQLTEQYGKEIATLKAKLAQQDAELAVKEEEDDELLGSKMSALKMSVRINPINYK